MNGEIVAFDDAGMHFDSKARTLQVCGLFGPYLLGRDDSGCCTGSYRFIDDLSQCTTTTPMVRAKLWTRQRERGCKGCSEEQDSWTEKVDLHRAAPAVSKVVTRRRTKFYKN